MDLLSYRNFTEKLKMEGKSWELGYLEEIDVEIFDSGMADPFSDTDDLDKRNLIEEMRKNWEK